MSHFWLREFARQVFGISQRRKGTITRRKPAERQPFLEALEIRLVPSTFTVTNTNDAGSGSLRAAIALANANSGAADTILFDSAVFGIPQTIKLTSGPLTLTDTSTTTITGPGASLLTISGNSASQVFVINSGDSASLSGLTITAGHATSQGGGVSSHGTLTMTNCTISGSTAISAGGGLSNYSGGTATLTNCTVSGNTVTGANGGAGGVQNTGSLTLNGCIISGNSVIGSFSSSGGLSNQGAATLIAVNTTISGNTATDFGGGMSANGTATLTGCTISGNSSPFAGGINEYVSGMTLTDCTVTGNHATNTGGGVYMKFGTLHLIDTTISANTANSGGGISNTSGSGTLTVVNTIVSANTATTNPDIVGTINTDNGHNLFGAALSGTTSGTGDVFNDTPQLAALGNYGGPTQTMLPLEGSPAIGAGSNTGGPANDQRGFTRASGTGGDIGGAEGTLYTVTTSTDGGAGSLRTDMTAASSAPGGSVIQFSAALSGSTITLGGTALPQVTGNLQIDGLGVSQLTISGNNASGVFSFSSTAVGALSGLTITAATGGAVNDSGTVTLTNSAITASAGGGFNLVNFSSGTATLTNVTVSGNAGTGVQNGGNGGQVTLVNCTVTGNTGPGIGTGIYPNTTLINTTVSGNGGVGINAFGNTLVGRGYLTVTNSTVNNNAGGGLTGIIAATVTNSTITGNSAANGAGVSWGGHTIALINSTVSGNNASSQGGGLLLSGSGAATVVNTIIAGNTAPTGPDVSSPALSVTSQGFNLIGKTDGSNTTWLGTDQIGTIASPLKPLLAALGYYGGPTQTMPPEPGSPALLNGNPSAVGLPATDQRGFPRVVSGAVDIGAFQTQAVSLTVVTTDDIATGVEPAGELSLRNAITLADALADASGTSISFDIPTSDAGYSSGTGVYTITATAALPTISARTFLDGTTQPSYTTTPVIQLTGLAAGAGVNGLTITAANSSVKGLAITSFGGDGILVNGAGATGNTLRANTIYNNTGLGIHLTNGGNNNAAAPVLLAFGAGSSTVITGTFGNVAGVTITLDGYANTVADARGGPGQFYLGGQQVTTGTGGLFTITLPGATLAIQFVAATATDAAGNTSQFSADVSASSAPAVAISAPTSAVAGAPVTLTSLLSDTTKNKTYTYAWTVTQNGNPAFSLPASAITDEPALVFVPPTPATYVAHLVVTDNLGGSATATPLNLVVRVPGPGVTISGAPGNLITANTPVSLTSAVTEPTGATPTSYTWAVTLNHQPYSLPVGTPTSGTSFAFTPTANGLYQISLTVGDSAGGTTTTSVFVTVAASGQAATIYNVPRTGSEGTQVVVKGAGNPSLTGPYTYNWAVYKNGAVTPFLAAPADTTGSFAFTPDAPGLYQVTLVITDSLGHTAAAFPVTVPVVAVPPTPQVLSFPANATVGQFLTLAGTATSAGTADPVIGLTWMVTSSNGLVTATGAGPTFNYTPSVAGTDTVTLTAVTASGSRGSSNVQIAVSPAPTLSVTAPSPLLEGTPGRLTAQVNNPHAGTYAFVWTVTEQANGASLSGTTSGTSPTSNFNFTPPVPGAYLVTVNATDTSDHTTVTVGPLTFQAANVAPTISAISVSPTTPSEGTPVTLSATTSGPGVSDGTDVLHYQWTVTGPDSFKFNATDAAPKFTPIESGSYSVKLTVTDSSGAKSAAANATFSVAHVTPTAVIRTTAGTGVSGSTLTANLTAVLLNDPGNDDAALATYTWTVQNTTTGQPVTTTGSGANVSFSGPATNAYTVTLSVTDDDGDHLSASIPFVALPAGTTKTLTASDVNGGTGIVVVTQGNSKVDATAISVPVTEAAVGAGHDTLVGGAGPSVLVGDSGNNSLVAGSGPATLIATLNDTLVGGSGSNLFSLNAATGEVVRAGTGGSNTLSFAPSGTGVLVQLGANPTAQFGTGTGAPSVSLSGSFQSLVGGSGNDTLMSGGASNVLIQAGSGNAQLIASGGMSVTMFGGIGNDTLSSSGGTSVSLVGGSGNSTLSSSGGSSVTMFGGTGNDSLSSTGGTGVTLVSGGGNTTLSSSGGSSVTMFGGTGNDTLQSSGGTSVSLVGGSGNETLSSSGGSSVTMFGGSGNDSLNSSGGTSVSMVGGSGNSTLSSSGGSSVTMFGGTGNDSLNSSGGTSVSMVSGGGNDTLTSSGGSSVTMFGGSGNDSLSSSGGTGITLVGGSGNETLSSSGGSSVTMFGGTGNDTLQSSGGTSVTMVGGSGNDSLTNSGGSGVVIAASNQVPSVTTLTATNSGSSYTFTAVVSANTLPSTSTPTGSVDFFDTTTGTDLGGVALSGGSATLAAPAVNAGDIITATYSGDGSFATSGSSQTLGAGLTTTVLTSSVTGTTISFSAKVSADAGGGAASGSVDFFDATAHNDLGSVALTAGSAASAAVTTASVSGHRIVATYAPAAGFSASSASQTLIGNTTLSSSGGSSVTMFGGTGNDSLSSSGGSSVTMVGGSGNSTLSSSGGTSVTMFGGSGNDSLSSTGGTGVTLVAGGGNDSLSSMNDSGVLLQGGVVVTTQTTGGTSVTMFGAAGNDTLSSTGGTNVTIVGGTGNESLSSSGGSSVTMFGGTGNDTLQSSGGTSVSMVGGSGNSTLSSSGGTGVTMFGGAGNSTLSANGGTGVTMVGGAGNSTLSADGSTDALLQTNSGTGTTGTASVTGGSSVTMFGGAGSDTLSSSGGTGVTIVGGSGTDTLSSTNDSGVLLQGGVVITTQTTGGSSVTMFGGTGNDSLSSSGGSSVTIVGGSGNDTLTSTGGTSVTMFGGTGNDSLNSSGGTSVSMVGGSGNDTLISSSGGSSVTMFGGSGNDSLQSSNGTSVTMVGGSGNSTLSSSGGSSVTMFGGTGNDSLQSSGGTSVSVTGGSGNDTLTSTGGTSVTMFGGTGNDSLSSSGGTGVSVTGGSGNDTLTSTGGTSVTMFGGSGNDSLSSSGGTSVTMVGGSGNSTLSSSGGSSVTMFGGTGNDSLSSSGGTGVSVVGGSGNDTLSSMGGTNVTLQGGGAGNDSITSSGGSSVTLFGGAGSDTLTANGGTAVGLYGLEGNNVYNIIGPITASLNDLGTFGQQQSLTDSPTFGTNTIAFPGLTTGITLDLSNASPGPTDPALSQNVAPGITLSLTGQFQNVVGTPGNDWIHGGLSSNLLDGDGGGNDTLIAGAGPATLVAGSGNDSLVAGSGGTDFRFAGTAANLGNVIVDPPAGSPLNVLDFSQLIGSVSLNMTSGSAQTISGSGLSLTLQNPSEINAVMGGAGTTTIIGNASGDTFFVGTGNTTVTGGGGSDAFFFSGSPTARDSIIETSTGNMLNFNALAAPINLSLQNAMAGAAQTVATGLTLTLSDPSAYDTIVGTPYADVITGNQLTNQTIIGGNGDDSLSAGNGNDLLQGHVTQVVYLDFTSTPSGDHLYTADEQAAILAGMQQDYADFDYFFTLDPDAARQAAVATGGQYVTIQFNAGNAGGASDALDPGNLDLGGTTVVNVNPFLGSEANGLVPPTDPVTGADNIVGLTTTIAAHELGHQSGLQHQDAFGPIGTGLFSGVNPDAFFPANQELQSLTATTLTSSGTAGSLVLTAVVSADPADTGTPTGAVDFFDTTTGKDLGSVSLSGGSATLSAPSVAAGDTVTATYGGSPSFLVSSASQTIAPPDITGAAKALTTTSLTSSTSADGNSFTFAVSVAANAPGGGTPTGSVDFFDATTGTDLSSLPLTAGSVSGVLSRETVAGQTILVTYSGDANFAPSAASQTIDSAPETARDIMASPASVGTTLLDAAQVYGPTYFGARDDIKLAFNDSGTVQAQPTLPKETVSVPVVLPTVAGGGAFTISQAFVVGNNGNLPGLAVPNTLASGTRDYGRTFDVTALAVNGALAQRSSQNFYAFNGQAGQLMTFQVISNNDTLNPQHVIPELLLVGPSGQVLGYNVHEFESADSTLLDVTLPQNGTYFVGVDSLLGLTAGNYQLFMYSYATGTGPTSGGGDTLVGGGGNDTILGSSANDVIAFAPGSQGSATVIAGSGQDFVTVTAASVNVIKAGNTNNVTTLNQQATPTVAVTGGGTFNGAPIPAVATVTGVSGTAGSTLEGVSPTLAYFNSSGASLPGAPTKAGTYTVVASFAGSADYTTSSATGTFTIAQVAPALVVTDGGTFNGSAHPATALLSGVSGPAGGSLDGVSPTFTYYAGSSATGTPLSVVPTSAGTYTVVAAFPGSTNYTSQSASSTFTIAQAPPVITWTTPSAITYGTALSATQLDAIPSVTGTLTYSPASGTVLGAGAQTLSVTFTPSDATDYTGATQTVQLLVNKATPTVTWVAPSAITFGTALGATQLDAIPSVTGTLTYTPAFGTVLGAGTQTLSVTFTPSDATDYNAVTKTVQMLVNKATPTVSWATPAGISFGTALSATQLNAGANVAGTFVYGPALGTVPAAGTQTLSVTFIPNDVIDYNTVTKTVQLAVGKTTPIITWDTPAAINYGTPLSGTQLDARANVLGTFAYNPAAGAVLGGGTQTLSTTFTPTDSADYNAVTQTTQLVVKKATPIVTWATPSAITFGTALGATQLDASASVDGTLTYATPAGTVLAAGTQTLSVTFTPTDSADYNAVTQTAQLVVNQATPTITWVTPSPITFGTALGATQLDATSSWTVGGITGAVAGTFAYSQATGTMFSAGTQTLSVTFTPADTTDYTGATQTVQLVVNKATPIIAWVNPGAITYGTALGGTQLDAASSWAVGGTTGAVAGTFAYTPASGTVLCAGTQTLSVTFTPADTTDYTGATQTVQLVVNKAVLTVTSNPATKVFDTANPTLTDTLSGFVNNESASVVSGLPSLTTTATRTSPVGTYPITASLGTLSAANYTFAFVNNLLTITLTPANGQSVFVLSQSAAGALSLSGNAQLNIASGPVAVDSSSSTAISVGGSAQVTAGSIQVEGGTQKSGSAKFSSTPVTGAGTFGDPLVNLAVPSASTYGLTAKGSVSVSGNSSLSIGPGIYTQIGVSGNGKLTMSAGIYVIAGGGFSVTGNGSVSSTGSGVMIYNAGSNYLGSGNSFGVVNLSGNGNISLTAPTSGPYAGILIFQSRDNTSTVALSGNGITMPGGVIYAPAAALTMSGNGLFKGSLVVNTLSLSANSVAQLTAGGVTAVYSPAQVRTAYGVNSLSLDGTGQTIAVVDAYDNPDIYQALDAFDAQFAPTSGGSTLDQLYGPASSFLTVVNQRGAANAPPPTDPAGAGANNWEMEESLDVEWAHAIAPGAQIVLVEADSQSLSDLMTAAKTAAGLPGVSVVSMSWGFVEGIDVLAQDEATYDSYLTTPAGHQGVTFVASTGDYGAAVPLYPAMSPNVVAVGGTSLTLNADNSYLNEVGWGAYSNALGVFLGSGGGLSQFEAEPAFQQGVQSTGSRTAPDVSLLADPATGAWVADPYNLTADNPWEMVGGTSLSAPAWGGLFALVDQGRVASGKATLGTAGPTEAQTALYGLSAADYHDVTTGSNGYSAGAGYDLVSGLGSPVANLLVPDLVAYSGGSPSSTPVAPVTAADLVLNSEVGSVSGTVAALARAAALRVFSAQSIGGGVPGLAPADGFGEAIPRTAAAGGVNGSSQSTGGAPAWPAVLFDGSSVMIPVPAPITGSIPSEMPAPCVADLSSRNYVLTEPAARDTLLADGWAVADDRTRDDAWSAPGFGDSDDYFIRLGQDNDEADTGRDAP